MTKKPNINGCLKRVEEALDDVTIAMDMAKKPMTDQCYWQDDAHKKATQALAELREFMGAVPDDLSVHIKNVNSPCFNTSTDEGWKSVVIHDKAAKLLHTAIGGGDE